MSDIMPTEHAPNILAVIDGAHFPLSKIELVEYAQEHDASEEVLDILQAMPDVIYRGMRDVNNHLADIEDLPNRGDLWSSGPAEELMNDNEKPLPDGTDHIIKI